MPGLACRMPPPTQAPDLYFGARADGEYATEPDKAAQVGRALVDFYEMTGEQYFLEAGLRIADELLKHQRDGDAAHSPWPFRVDVRDGKVIEEYTAHVIPAVRLFDELLRLGYVQYQVARDRTWAWLAAYPLQNNIWKGHFEDIRLDPDNGNRDQVSSLETARYLLEHRLSLPDWRVQVRGLIDWVKENLGGHPFFTAIPVHEQKYCYFPMGSHTARFASLSAQYAEAAGDERYAEQALRSFNWASYMANEDGTVTVGVDRPDYYNQCWFTDGYFDYVPHFIDGMAAMPHTAPVDSDHLLRSSSVVQEIHYAPYRIEYRLFDALSTQKLRLTFKPVTVLSGGQPLPQLSGLSEAPGWTFDEQLRLLLVRAVDRHVLISGKAE